jgi:hypothetical protein
LICSNLEIMDCFDQILQNTFSIPQRHTICTLSSRLVDLSIEMGKSVITRKLTTDFKWKCRFHSQFFITQNSCQWDMINQRSSYIRLKSLKLELAQQPSFALVYNLSFLDERNQTQIRGSVPLKIKTLERVQESQMDSLPRRHLRFCLFRQSMMSRLLFLEISQFNPKIIL